MKIHITLSFCLLFLITGCSKPEPNPELRDPIYMDLLTEKNNAEKNLTETKAKIDEYSTAMKKATPQTGQEKLNRKKFDDMTRRSEKIRQQIRYWDIRIEERLVTSRMNYMKSYHTKKAWPDELEIDAYRAQKRLRLSRLEWNQAERIQSLKTRTPASKPTQE